MNEHKLMETYPWLSDSDLATLDKKPWLLVYLEEGDETLDAARARHRLAQTEARKELKKRGKVAHRRVSVRGLQTTMLQDPLDRGTEAR